MESSSTALSSRSSVYVLSLSLLTLIVSWSSHTGLAWAQFADSSDTSLAHMSYRDSEFLSDFNEEWATMSGRVQKPKCVDIPTNLSLCQNIGYQRMMLPNLLQHDSMSEVTQQARSWVPLVGINCHPDTKVFLCSLFSPVCLDRLIYPCRTLCEGVRDSCVQRMNHYGFDWPKMLQCKKFPEDNDMCIKLIHDVKPDNNCSACKQPITYEAIIDNFCRAEFVSRVKIDRTEVRGMDRALILKKSKRYYKKENITKRERSHMEPVLPKGSSCDCDIINDTSKRYLLMGAHQGQQLVVTYVVEFPKRNRDFRRAFKDMRKANVCRSIMDMFKNDVDKTERVEKDDGICVACKMPMKYSTIVENYCLAEFVLRVSVTGLEEREGHQALVMKKKRKNYKKGSISRKEVRAMVPLLDGKEGCQCDLVTSNKKAKFLVFGSKRDDKYYINYVIQVSKRDPEFKKALKAIKRGDACVNILQGSSPDLEPNPSQKPQSGKGGKRGKGGKGGKGRKGKKDKRKGRKGKKGKRKGKRGRKGGKRNGANRRNSTANANVP